MVRSYGVFAKPKCWKTANCFIFCCFVNRVKLLWYLHYCWRSLLPCYRNVFLFFSSFIRMFDLHNWYACYICMSRCCRNMFLCMHHLCVPAHALVFEYMTFLIFYLQNLFLFCWPYVPSRLHILPNSLLMFFFLTWSLLFYKFLLILLSCLHLIIYITVTEGRRFYRLEGIYDSRGQKVGFKLHLLFKVFPSYL